MASIWNLVQRHDPGAHVLERTFPRDNTPNPNDPIGSVGPTVPAGFGDTHVMYPAQNPPPGNTPAGTNSGPGKPVAQ